MTGPRPSKRSCFSANDRCQQESILAQLKGERALHAPVCNLTSNGAYVVMTSLAFILGVVPLVLGQGAGAEMRRTLGTAVFAGMLGVTLFGIFLTPVFFYVIQAFADWRKPTTVPAAEPSAVRPD